MNNRLQVGSGRGRILAGLVLALMLSLILAACGDPTATPVVPTATTGATTSAATTAAATTAAPAEAATSTPVTLPSVTPGAATTAPARTTAAATVAATTAAASTSTAVASGAKGPELTQGLPRFEEAKCPFKLPADQKEGQTARCGYVVVPEQHSQANNGKTLKLATIIYKALGNSPAPEPIVFLQGGPGGGSQDFVTGFITGATYRRYAANNEVILFDQRGTGYSQPTLTCAELKDAQIEAYTRQMTQEQEDKFTNDALFKCRDRLASQNINFDAYNSAENAADVNDLRLALGYPKLNLHGASYGSRLGLEVMRDFPQAIRSIVLDSLVPPQVNLYADEPGSFDRAFKLLFQKCAADTSCNQAYPNLQSTFSKAVQQLDAKPVTVKVSDPETSKSYDVVVTGSRFTSAMQLLFYSTELLPLLPSLITQVQQGNSRALALPLTIALFSFDVAYGMYFSVQCSEEAPFNQPSAVQNSAQSVLPELKAVYNNPSSIFTVCQRWGVKPAPSKENEAISSNLPTLVFAGQFDPITPPTYAQTAAKTLSNATYIEVPNGGHGASLSTTDNCQTNIVLGFFANPTSKPDTSCEAQEKINFVTTGATRNNTTPTTGTNSASNGTPTTSAAATTNAPIYPGAVTVKLGDALEKQLGSALGGAGSNTQLVGLATKDEPLKVIDYYTKELVGQGYTTQPSLRQSTTQGNAKVEVAGFVKGTSVFIVSTQGPLDDATIGALSLQAPELADKVQAGDTLVILIIAGKN